jgi:NAD(P)-dependent dehydrogenase (short-subunit alcohol dehydrogenase family)
MKPLHNKIALVTGGSRGIGRAIALRLAGDGAKVIVNYASNAKAADDVVSAIKKTGGDAVAVKANVSNRKEIQQLFDGVDRYLTENKAKHLDILVNNAGVYPMGGLTDTTEELFDKVFSANVKGLLFVTQEAAKRMTKGARVINISTTLTRVGMPSMAVYNASKGAVDILTRDFAQELGAKGITVNAVNPGLVRTDGTEGMTSDAGTESYFNQNTALGRIGEPEDIAGAVAFLASDDSRWVTAQKIEASGGFHL